MPTPLESFRFGFLSRCAQNGLTAPEAIELAHRYQTKTAELNKQGNPLMSALGGFLGAKGVGGYAEHFGSKGLGYLEKLVPYLWGLAVPAAIGAPIAAGALGGYGLGSLHGIEDVDEGEYRDQELARAYREGSRQLTASQPRQPRQHG